MITNNIGNKKATNKAAGVTTVQTKKIIYTVHQVDSLAVLAKVYDVTIDNLLSWNNLNSESLYVGQKITIQVSKSTLFAEEDRIKMYTVQSGDSLNVISKVYNISMNDLKSWNNLKSDLLYVGKRLIVKR